MDLRTLSGILGACIQDKTLTIAKDRLGSAGVQHLLEDYLPGQQLEMQNAELTSSDDGVTVTGTITCLSVTDPQARAVFQPVGDDVSLKITIHVGSQWTFSHSFPSLADSLFDDLSFEIPGVLVLSSNEAIQNLEHIRPSSPQYAALTQELRKVGDALHRLDPANPTAPREADRLEQQRREILRQLSEPHHLAKGLSFAAQTNLAGPLTGAGWLLGDAPSALLAGPIIRDNGFLDINLKVQNRLIRPSGFSICR